MITHRHSAMSANEFLLKILRRANLPLIVIGLSKLIRRNELFSWRPERIVGWPDRDQYIYDFSGSSDIKIIHLFPPTFVEIALMQLV